MEISEVKQKDLSEIKAGSQQRGSAIVIALFVLVLVSSFVALALSRTAAEASAVGNETSEGRTFYAAQGSLEMMTRNFNKVFEIKLSPSDADFNAVRNWQEPGLTPQYTFNREVDQATNSEFTIIGEGSTFSGLYATRDTWRLRTTATDPSGVQIQLSRNILNNRIPIFQFGIFYNDDMEIHPGPRFDFGGRVHSNGSIFLMSSGGIYFSSKVSAVGEILTDIGRNGRPWTQWGENVFIRNGANYVQLRHEMGSAVTTPANGTALFRDPTKTNYNPDMPTVYKNAGWTANESLFGKNLLANQPSLDLPLKIASRNNNRALDYVELIKRGRSLGDLHNNGGTPTAPVVEPVTAATADSMVTVSERYYNKTGIRISLASSKAKLPGCASGVGTNAITGFCGVRLDGASVKPAANAVWADADANGSHGYQPLPMVGGYQATRLNGERFRTSAGQVWIKIEMISRDPVTNAIITNEITEDILSLGVTEAPAFAGAITGYGTKDSRSVIKMQRFAIPGVNITTANNANTTYLPFGGTSYNVVKVSEQLVAAGVPSGVELNVPNGPADTSYGSDNLNHTQTIFVSSGVPTAGTQFKIVPFPIEMFDSREGIYNVDTFNPGSTYGSTNVPWAGVMSLIDVDITNLKNFLDGTYNASMPINTDFYTRVNPNRALRNTDVPQNNGWVVYTSDRRGDSDFDGEYDMEDIFGGNNNILDTAEDINKNRLLDVNYTNEAARYVNDGLFASAAVPGSYAPTGMAASVDHPFYRRGFRLIRGERLPGGYDSANSANTRGFTFASENAVYVLGNYNATGVASYGTPTPYSDYLPIGAADVPASIVGDAIYILSNSWQDSRSFLYPFDWTGNKRKATETTVRFALISGDAISSYEATPNQGGGDPRLAGGVHNFKRFLEAWTSIRLNYCGSLINLYNAHNNNGAFKLGNVVYDPPNRNWVFDSTFLDPTRLPPGTPYFQYIQTTGFQRTND